MSIKTINIKPLSVNEAWQGKRFKSDKYKKYEENLLLLLPKIEVPKPPYFVYLEFGLSSILSDIDNPVKPFIDVLQKKYKINDKDIFNLNIKKVKVNKFNDYIKFHISTV
jgi:hypothetical protein